MTTADVLRETKVPALPSTAAIQDPAVKSFLDKLKELVEVREGLRGDVLDQAVTFRDVYQQGLLQAASNGKPYIRLPGSITYLPTPPNAGAEFLPPPAVTNLAAIGALANIIITFDQPDYWNHAYTEIWSAGTNNLSLATRIGTTPASVYADNLGTTGGTRYYWVRNVSTANVIGEFNAVSGTSATTGFVDTPNLANLSVTNGKIANLAVDDGKIANLSAVKITAGDIATARMTANILAAAQASIAHLSAITADLGTITAGNITLDTSGFIRGGQTAYNTGVGFFLGYSSSAYKFSIGDPSGKSLLWDGSNLVLNGSIVGTSNVVANAITNTFSSFAAGGVGAPSSVDTDVLTLSVTTTGAQVKVTGFFTAVYGGAGTCSVSLVLRRNNVDLAFTTIQSLLPSAQGEGRGMAFSDTPAAGTYTYQLTARPNANVTCFQMSLDTIETKR